MLKVLKPAFFRIYLLTHHSSKILESFLKLNPQQLASYDVAFKTVLSIVDISIRDDTATATFGEN